MVVWFVLRDPLPRIENFAKIQQLTMTTKYGQKLARQGSSN